MNSLPTSISPQPKNPLIASNLNPNSAYPIPRNCSATIAPSVLLLPSPPLPLLAAPSTPVVAAALALSVSNRLRNPSNPSRRAAPPSSLTPTTHPGTRQPMLATGSTSFRHAYPTAQPTPAATRLPGSCASASCAGSTYVIVLLVRTSAAAVAALELVLEPGLELVVEEELEASRRYL